MAKTNTILTKDQTQYILKNCRPITDAEKKQREKLGDDESEFGVQQSSFGHCAMMELAPNFYGNPDAGFINHYIMVMAEKIFANMNHVERKRALRQMDINYPIKNKRV